MQQERKFDFNQLIGFGLMALIFGAYVYFTRPDPEEIEKQKIELAQKEQAEKEAKVQTEEESTTAFVPTGEVKDVTLENDKIKAVISGKGGQISSLELKNFTAYDSTSFESESKPLFIINDGNSVFDLVLKDKSGKEIRTSNLLFSPTVQKQGNNTVATFSAQAGSGQVQFIYTLSDTYNISFDIRSNGLSQITNEKKVLVDWKLDAFTVEKGKDQEDYWSQTYYRLKDDRKVDYELFGKDTWIETEEDIDWIAFKQQFFASFLSFDEGFTNATGSSIRHENQKIYSKAFHFQGEMNISGAELNQKLNWDFVPLDYKLLKKYNNKDFDEVISFGWGIMGWLNKYFFLNIFQWLAKLGIEYGWVIFLMTIVVKLVLSPIMFRQFRQSAMMKVLRPEINELNEKYPDKKDAMKKQQATMELYRKAGVNPLAGCLPGLLQIPIFYALFRFFPNIIDLRGESFLWAADLTAYDSFIKLPQWVPFLDGHLSIFALLYVLAMVIYFKVSGSADSLQMPQQEGMPNMQIMKYMMYIMPIFFFVFLNSYASGLSWYYLVSNVINIGIVLFIKNVMLKEEKIHAKIEANKAKPAKKKSGFSQKMQDLMEKAQQQQESQKKELQKRKKK